MMILTRKYRCGFIGASYSSPKIAKFESNVFQRKSKKGKVHLVKKRRKKKINKAALAAGTGLALATIPTVLGLALIAKGSKRLDRSYANLLRDKKKITTEGWDDLKQAYASAHTKHRTSPNYQRYAEVIDTAATQPRDITGQSIIY